MYLDVINLFVRDKQIPPMSWDRMKMWEFDLLVSDYIDELQEREKKRKKQSEESNQAMPKMPKMPKMPQYKQPKF